MRVSSGRRIASLLALVALACVSTAPSAGATTFCVPVAGPNCPSGGVAQPSLSTAMTTNGSDGIADTVLVAPGTYTNPSSFFATGSDPLAVQGSGTASTVLTTSSNSNIYVVDLNTGSGRTTTLRDLTIELPTSFPDSMGNGAALQARGSILTNVDIRSLNPQSAGAVSWVGGGSWTGGRIYGSGAGSISRAVAFESAFAGSLTLRDLTVEDASAPFTFSSAPNTVTLERAHVIGSTQPPVSASEGYALVRNSVFETSGAPALSVFVNSPDSVILQADNVTAVNSGPAMTSAVSSVVGSTQTGNGTLVVSDSILRGYPLAYNRSASTSATFGNASLVVHHANFPDAAVTPGAETSTGDGTLAVSVGNIDADPLFASATDFSLRAGSPSIDAGDPASTVTSDFLGAPRPVDGNADGTAATDQGAYEFQPAIVGPPLPPADTTAPNTIRVKGPAKRIRVRKAALRFRSSEAGSTFQCKVGKKAYRSCRSPLRLKKLKLGKHVVLVRAIDEAGNTDPSPLRIAFRVLPRR